MMGPVEFVVLADIACLGAATLLMALGILAGVVIGRIKAPSNSSVDLEQGVGTDGQRAL